MADEILGHTTEEWMPMPPQEGPPLPSFLGIFWPWYKPPAGEVPPGEVTDIRVENPVISPAQVNVGEKVTISVTAKNYGAVAGSKTITCTVS